MTLKIGFFGTPELAQRVLVDILSDERFSVEFVVTNPDKPFGRDQRLTPTPVKLLAESHHIEVFTPQKIRNNTEFLDAIRAYGCDYFVVVAYGKILPQELLDIPKKMCVNVHGSLLPKYRGASPIQSALLAGETETGVTIMQMSAGMDEGDMIHTERITISPTENSATLFEKFAEISGQALITGILGLEDGSLTLIPQDDSAATYCSKISKEDGRVDWSLDAVSLFHCWQAYTPWPGLYTFLEDTRLLLESISPEHIHSGLPAGTLFLTTDNRLAVATKEGSLVIHTLKKEGKKSQSAADFLRGHAHILGINLS